MKKLFLSLFVLLFFEGYSQIIPVGSIEPQWMFPIYFEDSYGFKDTLYIGYDSTASTNNYVFNGPLYPTDSIFGELPLIIDTSIFNVYWNAQCQLSYQDCDSAQKVIITPQISLFFFDFINAKYPIKVSYDISLFRNTDTPFSQSSTQPDIQAKICVDSFDCFLSDDRSDPYCGYISDSSYSFYSDSIFINVNSGGERCSFSYIAFAAWTGAWLEINTATTASKTKISPNPTHGIIHFSESNLDIKKIIVRDQIGRLITSCNYQETLNLNNYPNGIYFVQLFDGDDTSITHKVVKY